MALTKIPAELSSTPGISDSSTSTAITIDSSGNVTFNGTVTATAVTQSAGDGSTKIATTAYADAAAAAVVDAAPSTLDTLNELAAALGDDPNFATTVTTSIAAKAPIANPTFTGSFTSPGIDDNADAIAITIDSSENVGIGGAPNAGWRNDATDRILTLGTEAAFHSDAGVTTELWNNAYVDNSDTFKNISTRGASRYMQYSGAHKWFTAASASAGSTISTEINSSPKMVLDVSGNVGIGTSSPLDKLDVAGNLRISDGGLVFDKPTVYGFRFLHNDAGNDLSIQQGDVNNANYVTRLNIGSSGNVGIGAAPDTTGFGGTFKYLGVNGGSGYGVFNGQTSSTTAADAAASFFGSTTGSSGLQLLGGMQVVNGASSASNAEGALVFYTATGGSIGERLRIDSSGNVLVGTTDTTLYNNTTGGGIALMGSNRLDVARSGDIVATFNRTTDDGAIVQFYDRGTLSGQIGVESAGVFLGNPLNGGGLRIGGNITAPSNSSGSASNNTQDLGTSSFRWKTIYAVNALNTSDEKLKQDIEGLSDAEKRVAVALKALVKKYRFKDEVTAQGSDAKIRVGLIAQQVVSAFDDEGLTATDYALLSHETDTDAQFNELETKTYSINYSELLAFIISAI